ncbi:MAG: type I DNA topoisomerase [Armatimonadetes bacterium]|nr:type I DNA topoisomerase [Armatimonadota bacterium]
MGKSLIIVESAAKTRTISGFLGAGFELAASVGHVRDLPQKDLGVDVERDFSPTYEVMKDKAEVIKRLKSAAKKADKVYLATDPDREGEAIAWHLQHALGLREPLRIEFNEITRSAVEEALAHPRQLDIDRVNAQQARRVLDRLVGYKLSPLLWRKVKNARSAGRVQSVAVRLIVEREREIREFVATEYWRIIAKVAPDDRPNEVFEARLDRIDGKKIEVGDIGSEAAAQALVDELGAAELSVASLTTRKSSRRPPPPFITSTLQRDASNRLGFRAARTMSVAQKLYEGVALSDGETLGLITYMRTDSTRVANEAANAAQQLIKATWGAEYAGKGSRGKTVKGAQEAHECIRPSYVDRHPDEIDKLLAGRENSDLRKLYRLIWTRFVASQMAPAQIETTSVEIAAGRLQLRASGSQVLFPGYMALTGLPQAKKSDDEDDEERDDDLGRLLPALREGEPLDLKDLASSQHFTQPPPRYTEASLVKTLEERGIGRPSTYAPILSTITERRYVSLEQGRFVPTGLGEAVTDALVKHFPTIMDVDFTASLESELDEVERGETDWVKLLREFYSPFEAQITGAYEEMERIRVEPVETEHDCPKCGAKMLLREGRYGQFLGCSRYPDCDQIMRLDKQGNPVPAEGVETEHRCPECGGTMRRIEGRYGPYLRCERHPECEGRLKIDRRGEVVATEKPQATPLKCEKCGSPLVLRNSRRGPFLGCSSYPKCRNITRLDDDVRAKLTAAGITVPEASEAPAAQTTSVACPDCGKPMLLRHSRRGPFLGCSGYPKCRGTRNLDDELREKLQGEGIAL